MLPLRSTQEDIEAAKAWHDDIVRTALDDQELSPGAQLALLTCFHSEHAIEVMSLLRADRVKPRRNDWRALRKAGLAVDANGFHDLTPRGRVRAGQVIHHIAKERGLHLTSYGVNRSARYGRGEYHARCTCGWSATMPMCSSAPSVMRGHAATHLSTVKEVSNGNERIPAC